MIETQVEIFGLLGANEEMCVIVRLEVQMFVLSSPVMVRFRFLIYPKYKVYRKRTRVSSASVKRRTIQWCPN